MSPTSERLATTSFNRFLIIIIIFNTPEAVIIRTRASGAYATSQRRLAKPSINLNASDVPHLHTQVHVNS